MKHNCAKTYYDFFFENVYIFFSQFKRFGGLLWFSFFTFSQPFFRTRFHWYNTSDDCTFHLKRHSHHQTIIRFIFVFSAHTKSLVVILTQNMCSLHSDKLFMVPMLKNISDLLALGPWSSLYKGSAQFGIFFNSESLLMK